MPEPQIRYTEEGYPYYVSDGTGDPTTNNELRTGWPFADKRPAVSNADKLKAIGQQIINSFPIEQPQDYDPLVELGGYLNKNGTGLRPLDLLFGLAGQERYQMWPERMVRSAVTLPQQVVSGEVPTFDQSGHTSPALIERTQDLAGLAMSGGIPAMTKGALGMAGGRLPIKPREAAADVLAAAERSPEGLSAKKAEAAHGAYKETPDNLLGFRREGPQKSFYDQAYSFSLPVRVKDPIGGTFVDEVKGLNQAHALERAKRNWPDAQVEPMPEFVFRSGQGEKGAPLALSQVNPTPQPKAPVWYSPTEQAVRSFKQNSATPDQWLGTIRNMPGVKQEELQWLGLEDWLKTQKGPVTKQQIEDFIASNKVEVRDIQKGFPESIKFEQVSPTSWKSDKSEIRKTENGYEIFIDGQRRATAYDLPQAQQQARQLTKGFVGNENVKYSDYQLPGGKNYNELLLTLPRRPEVIKQLKDGSWMIQSKNGSEPIYGNSKSDALENFAKSRAGPNEYSSPHWDEPNVLAHVRFNERNIDGKKTLFMEEVQSDWHQTGRKSGYKSEIENLRNEVVQARQKAIEAGPSSKDWDEYHKVARRLETAKGSGVPDAPFKKTWPDLVLKRMIRYAAENGYDAIAWTPGEVQAARWRGTGEHGHEKFYDEILVNAANRLGKAYGSKTSKLPMATKKLKMEEKFDPSNYQKVHTMPITPAMRDVALGKGMPLFSGGFMLIPVGEKVKSAEERGMERDIRDLLRNQGKNRPLNELWDELSTGAPEDATRKRQEQKGIQQERRR